MKRRNLRLDIILIMAIGLISGGTAAVCRAQSEIGYFWNSCDMTTPGFPSSCPANCAIPPGNGGCIGGANCNIGAVSTGGICDVLGFSCYRSDCGGTCPAGVGKCTCPMTAGVWGCLNTSP